MPNVTRTVVEISSLDELGVSRAVRVEVSRCDLNGEDLAGLLRQAMAGMGYAQETVAECFGDASTAD